MLDAIVFENIPSKVQALFFGDASAVGLVEKSVNYFLALSIGVEGACGFF